MPLSGDGATTRDEPGMFWRDIRSVLASAVFQPNPFWQGLPTVLQLPTDGFLEHAGAGTPALGANIHAGAFVSELSNAFADNSPRQSRCFRAEPRSCTETCSCGS